jgi:pilus assembly protein TadC
VIVAALLAAIVFFARIPTLRRRLVEVESTVADLARLLSIAAAAGLPLGTALETVAPEIRGPLGDEVGDLLRSARTIGLTAALLSSTTLGPLGSALARAHNSGSPLTQTLDAHLRAHSAERVARALEIARTAPVKVMVPLALLLLPGFTALVVGPTLLDHVIDVTRFGR